ncbi:hypothetical protein B0H11DRAFT_2221563 [Mycena galericulata]|nr:hypothetical protein B0H11DRAFT_2221563 [Mycena galericulata]
MPRAGVSKRRRERLGLAPVKPGQIGWVHGTKLPFFEVHKDDFLKAAENKVTGAFYNKVAHLYLATYGYNIGWKEDLEEDQVIADDVDPNEDVDKLPADEAARRADYLKILRGKIGVWYNTKYGGSVERKKKKVSFKALFDKPELDPPAPVKPRTLHFYSRRFYHARIKSRVTARWAAVQLLGLEKPPKEITVRNAVTKECWEGETDEFKTEVEESLKAEHQVAMDAYSVATSGEAPSSAEEYNIALNNAAYYLQPFADAAHERYGMNVAILLCGPIPDRGGRIEMRSIHSGMTNGLVPGIWSDVDRAGFDAAQRSFVQFSHQCFTEADCKARSLKGAEEAVGHVKSAPETTSTIPPDTETATPVVTPPETTTSTTPPPPPEVTSSPAAPVEIAPAQPRVSPEHEDRPLGQELLDQLDLENQELGGLQMAPFDERQLELFDADLLRDPLGEGGDINSILPSDISLGRTTPPKIGRALRRELAELSEDERGAQMAILEGMTEDGVEKWNDRARDRLLFARMDRGMLASEALEMSSGSEDEGGEEDAQSKAQGKKKSMDVARSQPARPRPRPVSADPSKQQELANSGAGLVRDTPEPDAVRSAHTAEVAPLSALVGGAIAPATATAPAPAPGTAEIRGGEKDWWDTQEQEKWTPELVKAFAGLARGKMWGGEEWERCVSLLLDLEEIGGFRDKGMLKAPAGKERPEEVEEFMKLARRWGSPFPLKTKIGPKEAEGSFAHRWWGWWECGQPAARGESQREWRAPAELDGNEWEEMRKRHGRNGVLMYIGGLLWWGEAAAADEEQAKELLADWHLAVQDVRRVLEEVVKPVGPSRPAAKNPMGKSGAKHPAVLKPATGKTSSKKRKTPDTISAVEKENEQPQ